MNELAAKWDKKFATQSCNALNACEVLLQNRHLLPVSGTGLDYACGLGANAVLLAESNLITHAWDISTVAIKKLDDYAKSLSLNISTLVRDIEKSPPEPNSFDVIVVANFLHRSSFSDLKNALCPGGLLFYQTFITNKVNEIGPSNPDFLLANNELLRLCEGMEVLVYREEGVQGNTNSGFRDQAMVVAKRVN